MAYKENSNCKVHRGWQLDIFGKRIAHAPQTADQMPEAAFVVACGVTDTCGGRIAFRPAAPASMSRQSTLPKRLQPMLATLMDAQFDDPDWVHKAVRLAIGASCVLLFE